MSNIPRVPQRMHLCPPKVNPANQRTCGPKVYESRLQRLKVVIKLPGLSVEDVRPSRLKPLGSRVEERLPAWKLQRATVRTGCVILDLDLRIPSAGKNQPSSQAHLVTATDILMASTHSDLHTTEGAMSYPPQLCPKDWLEVVQLEKLVDLTECHGESVASIKADDKVDIFQLDDSINAWQLIASTHTTTKSSQENGYDMLSHSLDKGLLMNQGCFPLSCPQLIQDLSPGCICLQHSTYQVRTQNDGGSVYRVRLMLDWEAVRQLQQGTGGTAQHCLPIDVLKRVHGAEPLSEALRCPPSCCDHNAVDGVPVDIDIDLGSAIKAGSVIQVNVWCGVLLVSSADLLVLPCGMEEEAADLAMIEMGRRGDLYADLSEVISAAYPHLDATSTLSPRQYNELLAMVADLLDWCFLVDGSMGPLKMRLFEVQGRIREKSGVCGSAMSLKYSISSLPLSDDEHEGKQICEAVPLALDLSQSPHSMLPPPEDRKLETSAVTFAQPQTTTKPTGAATMAQPSIVTLPTTTVILTQAATMAQPSIVTLPTTTVILTQAATMAQPSIVTLPTTTVILTQAATMAQPSIVTLPTTTVILTQAATMAQPSIVTLPTTTVILTQAATMAQPSIVTLPRMDVPKCSVSFFNAFLVVLLALIVALVWPKCSDQWQW
ncbi:hypothetical protein CEUSTIGMA_g2449.t1 [Chlamydomonas eustigma]|uniref:Uncharacterized protein n=1 Tax=Chlamydomonas eustigma TaxID=1157962 RepID=A0A250WVX9_9CHLO|nr:hypothetical protein CEUSTIGMA_g2449.t1 [Chlamydomonas eustigma]|eukprot:GAX75003.1 hypothetical protein CEUSTIGMA_g2449.t1 [Chlamydomonas eustigma]